MSGGGRGSHNEGPCLGAGLKERNKSVGGQPNLIPLKWQSHCPVLLGGVGCIRGQDMCIFMAWSREDRNREAVGLDQLRPISSLSKTQVPPLRAAGGRQSAEGKSPGWGAGRWGGL